MLADVSVRALVNGPEAFTPDGTIILGEAPEVENFFVGAGFDAFGIESGGRAGWALAEWVRTRQAPMDQWNVDIRSARKLAALPWTIPTSSCLAGRPLPETVRRSAI
jgi:glycine/D-amino acid oxidase-like deaminating enzyme